MSRAPELTRLAAPSTRRSCARLFIEVSMIMRLFTAPLQNLQVRLGLQGGSSVSRLSTQELDHVGPSCPVAPMTTTQELDHVEPHCSVAPQMSATRRTR